MIRDGLKKHPYYLDARLLHARVLLELGDEEAARIEFEHILTLDPANPLACMALGVERVETQADGSGGGASTDDWLEALEETWRSDEADWRAAPKGAATGAAPAPTKSIETPTLAGLYASQGLFDRAIAVYEQMLSRNPDDAELIAAIAEMRRRAEEAREPRKVQPAPEATEAAEAADPAVAESIGEQLRRILDGETPAGSD